MFNKLTLFRLLFNSPHTIHTNQYLCISLDSVLNTEIQYNKNEASYAKQLCII